DAGVPPQFDFAASQNLKQVVVQWPVPQRIEEAGGITIGYLGGVIFPLRVEPRDPAKPVLLRLKLDYAICEKLCVPAEAKAELAGGRGEPGSARPRVLVDVVASGAVDLFAEGPTPQWALPLPTKVAGAPAGQQRFAFELDGLPPGAS